MMMGVTVRQMAFQNEINKRKKRLLQSADEHRGLVLSDLCLFDKQYKGKNPLFALYQTRYEDRAYRFNYHIGKDIKGFFKPTIGKLSLSQIYAVIYNTTKDSEEYYQQMNISIN